MGKYLAGRLFQFIPVLFGISVVSFLIIHLAPGDPTGLRVNVELLTDQELLDVRQSLGLEEPLPVQFVKTLGALLTGKLVSFATSQPTWTMILEGLPTTLGLLGGSILFACVFGIPLGVASALRPYTKLDNSLTVASLFGVSIPQFWFGLMLIFVFAESLGVLPATGLVSDDAGAFPVVDILRHLLLPVLVMGTVSLPPVVRYTRSAMMESLSQDFVRTAQSKGLPKSVVVYRHALKNSLLPVVTVLGMLVPLLLGASVVVEYVFALPGIGRMAIAAALTRDYPVVITINFMAAVIALVVGLLVDIAYSALDPRIRHG
ncbi:MAG: ABC transporter permease [Nitrospinota bacterium]